MLMSPKAYVALALSGVVALSGFLYWQSGRIELVVVVENAPMYPLEGGVYSYVKENSEIARIPKGTIIR